MSNWVRIEDVTNRYDKPIPSAKLAWVQTLLDDAEDELVRVVAGIQQRVTSGELPLLRVRRVVASAVIEVLRNPDGYQSHSQSVGPYSTSYTRTAGTASAGRGIRFTDEDLEALRPDSGAPARSIGLSLPAWRVP